jgi:putative ABC transport system permease protein
MLRTTLKNLAARKLRLLTTGFAVLLGVAFMAGTLVLTATIGASFDDLFADAYEGTDAYVRGEIALESDALGDQRVRLDAALIDRIRAVDGVRAVEGDIEAYAQIVGRDGEPLGNPDMGAPVLGSVWITDDTLNPYEVVAGRAPAGMDEVVIDRHSADTGELDVGDTISVLTQAGTIEVELVGIATFAGTDSPGGASMALFTAPAAQAYLTEPGRVDAVRIAGDDGLSQADLVARVESVVPAGATEVLTGAQITRETQRDIKEDMGFLNTFLLAFAVIALFVGSFIIYNSFSILVAQRTREMALLRAIGARRRQVMGSVLLEATAVGLVASVAGIVLGIGIAVGLKALLSGMGIDLPGGTVVVGCGTVLASLVAGLGVSVASAVLPARRAAKVAPVAAMRDVAVDDSAHSRVRSILGVAVTGLGAVAMAAGLFGDGGPAPVGLGALVVFLGVAVLGPVLARPMSRVLGAPVAALRGLPGSLARENAMRNPKRTAATASALMIGVALVGFITIMASSMKASIDETVERSFTGDLVVESGTFGAGGLPADLAGRVAQLPEVEAASGFRMAAADVDGHAAELMSVDPTQIERVVDLDVQSGSLAELGANQLAVTSDEAEEHGWSLGDTLTVRFAETGEQPFTLVALFDEADVFGNHLVGHAALEANVADQFDVKIAVALAEGIDLDAGRAAVESVTDASPLAEVQDRDEYREASAENVEILLHLIYALLLLAIVIALLGITNTLGLSILERTRELGLLRAVGMTRSQLRATVRYESVIIALLGTTLGLLIGIAFGWAFVQAMHDIGISTFAVPVGQLAVVAAIAAVAGVAAAILPARRAARLDVLAAIVAT